MLQYSCSQTIFPKSCSNPGIEKGQRPQGSGLGEVLEEGFQGIKRGLMNPFSFVVIFSENRLGKSVTIRSGYSANRDFFFFYLKRKK